MEALIIFFALGSVVLLVATAFEERSEDDNNLERSDKKSKEHHEISNIDAKYTNDTTTISIDNIGKRIIIARSGEKKIYGYSELTGAEVEIDGNQAASANVTGAAVGGALFGGAGAIVGAMVKPKTCKSIRLKLYFSDVQNPTFHISFFDSMLKTNVIYPSVKNALREVDEWYGRMLSILKNSEGSQGNLQSSNSVADELEKFAKLKDCGVISNQEFIEVKARLLGS